MTYFVAIKSKEDCSEALAAARRHSPNIEIVDETTLVFDLTGSKAKDAPRIARELRERFEAVAVSENLAAALLLARWGREEFKVQSSRFKVPEEDSPRNTRKTLNGKEDVRESGSAGEQTQNSKLKTQNFFKEAFKADKSEYRAGPLIISGEEFNARADKDRRRKASRFRVQEEEFKVREEQFKVQGSKFKVRNAEAKAKEDGSSEQTLNVEPGTLNAPPERAGVREGERTNSKPKTQNPKPKTQNSPSTQYSVPSTLSVLPIDAISHKAEFLELMDSWAIHDLGSFSQLPEDGMVERFGQEIIELRKQAAGEAFRAPNWNVKDDKFFWAKELEGAIETIEPLNFVLSKGVEQIFQNLEYAALSTQSAKITLRGRKKEKSYRIRIVFPTRNQKLWIRQIVTKIELASPQFNIDRVEIEFRSTKPRTVQNNLYSGVILEPENLNLIVTKLKKVVGLSKIGLPKLRDSWSEQFYMTEDLSSLIRDEGGGIRGRGDAGESVQSLAFRVRSSAKQTQNPKLKTQNSLSTQEGTRDEGGGARKFGVQSSKFKVRNAEAKAKEDGSSQQTLNLEPGTLNAPPEGAKAGGREGGRAGKQTQNPKPKTQNSPGTQYSVPSTRSESSVFSSVFYYLPQPIKARVFFESGEPKALIIKGKRELVRMSGGPWRKDAEWYRTKKWQRDEWDIETETGAIYRVFTDKNGEAFVDGGYD